MKLTITPSQLQAQPGLIEILLAKLITKVNFGPDDLSRTQIQYCLNNNINLDKAVLFSPVMTAAQINADVPASWPRSTVKNELDEDVLLTYSQYLRPTEVTGGWVLQYADGPMDAHQNISLPMNTYLRAQITKFGGFLTKAEVDAIKIVPEPEL